MPHAATGSREVGGVAGVSLRPGYARPPADPGDIHPDRRSKPSWLSPRTCSSRRSAPTASRVWSRTAPGMATCWRCRRSPPGSTS